ncbi:DUF2786 domain-containing protein [Corynebacterium timonense]|uniref:Uncharacterized protein n=1 Tax=Corynebacterium timonense TaxID=441500 RepID=A0A1H1SP23_9CORY|nr:DUF2786 domain-containing protein [Corynebacterium timonense]SDS49613.1 Protein of unknown function [Corynebacterium timonense]
MRDIDKVKQKVRKLLDHAADRDGTPEGDLFYAKAFEYMAAYGFEERDLERPDAGDEVERRTFSFSGAYTDRQAGLLMAIASALHCTGFVKRAPNTTRVVEASVFGARRHLERAEMLYTLLNPVMLTGARRHARQESFEAATVVQRRSFMIGFASAVGERLSTAEDTVACGDDRYALALVGDLHRAEDARDAFAAANDLLIGTSRPRGIIDGHAYGHGVRAGDSTDLGQDRVRSRPALPS